MHSDDFNLKLVSILTTSLFKKKIIIGLGEDDFTFNVVLPHNDLTHLKKKSTNPILQIHGQNDSEIQKSL